MPGEKEVSKTLVFFVNGKKVEDSNVNPEDSLLSYLRVKLGLCGTKLSCGEGGCGACTVMVSKHRLTDGSVMHYSVNACLAPVASMHGLAVTTVEGIGSTREGLHAVQERIAKAHGSQCGFCTPGMVMSMYTLLRNNPVPSMVQIDQYFSGNLCRCTGYRPILDGFSTFTSDGLKTGGCGKADCCMLNEGKPVTVNGTPVSGITNGKAECCNGDTLSYEETNLTSELYNKSQFMPYDPTQEIIFPPEIKVNTHWQHQELEFDGPRVKFFRPSSLARLLQLKAQYPEAKIIVGNTEVGVEVGLKHQLYPILINPTNLTELTTVEVNDSGVMFGASLTLTAIEDVLIDQIEKQPEYQTRIFSAILDMLRWFGGKQIRNVAAIGGNIMTGSPISDLNPLLMAARATLTLCSKERGERQVVMDQNFFTGYRKNIVLQDEILLSVLVPYTEKDDYFSGYKQSRRKGDDLAIVNAGMKVTFHPESDIVKEVILAYGGMAPTTVMATETMQKLIGMKWDQSLLDLAINQILTDLPLSPSAPGGMAAYRRALTVSFFFKFFLSVRGHLSEKMPQVVEPLTEEQKRAIEQHIYEPPRCTQVFQKVPTSQTPIDPIGRPIVNQSALQHATGEAVYVDDIPEFKKELYGAFVYSTRAHAKILSIDESAALEVEGVAGFFCSRDVPNHLNTFGIGNDEEVFASEKVTAMGQIVGLVVAKDKRTAKEAARMVNVQYEDLYPRILTIQDAIAEESYFDQYTLQQGDTESAMKAAPHVLEGEMHTGGQEHFYMETQAVLAVPVGENGEMDVYSSTQSPYDTQILIAKLLAIPGNRVTCKVKRLGGGFGGKSSKSITVALPVSMAAARLNCPVRLMLDRDDDMVMSGGRHPFLCRWKAGFSEEGILLAVEMNLYGNGGYSWDTSEELVKNSMIATDSAYRCANRIVKGYICKTNMPSNVAYRAFGVPQAVLFAEDIMTKITAFLKMEPHEIRERNMYTREDIDHTNKSLEESTLRQCWDDVIRKSDYHSRKKAVEKFNSDNRYRKKGIFALPLKYGIGFHMVCMRQAGALVMVYTDGTVLLSHGGVEMGQGLHTKMIQVAARVLKIPHDKIHIADTSTNKVPNISTTAGSMSSDMYGNAVRNACETINKNLKPFVDKDRKGSWEDWVTAAYFDRVPLSATGFYKVPGSVNYDFKTREGDLRIYNTYGAAVTEVEIDCLTGDHSVLRTDLMTDVGESLNPAIDIGQIEGAFIQGLGLVTMEELCYSPEGNMLTKGPGSYKIPSFQDIPKEFNVNFLRGSKNLKGIYSSKATSEPPLVLAMSIFYAIKDAITAARAESGLDALFRLDSPATAERIRMACQDFITEKISIPEAGSFKPWSIVV